MTAQGEEIQLKLESSNTIESPSPTSEPPKQGTNLPTVLKRKPIIPPPSVAPVLKKSTNEDNSKSTPESQFVKINSPSVSQAVKLSGELQISSATTSTRLSNLPPAPLLARSKTTKSTNSLSNELPAAPILSRNKTSASNNNILADSVNNLPPAPVITKKLDMDALMEKAKGINV